MAEVTPADFTAFLQEFGLSRRAAGELLGRTGGMISHWEKGRKLIPIYVVEWMARCRKEGKAIAVVVKDTVTPPLPNENRKKIDLEHHPEAEAAAIDALTDPHWERLSDAARACGLNPKTARFLIERLRTRLLPVSAEIRKHKTAAVLSLMEDRRYRALEYLDDVALAQSSGRDLAVIAGVLTDKIQLLEGKPTQILSVEDRRKLNEIIPLFIREARRRGVTIDLRPGEYSVQKPGG